MSMPTIWHIPYELNGFFTGREEVLPQLHNTLQADTRVALSHPLAIIGLGGIGKTDTALKADHHPRSVTGSSSCATTSIVIRQEPQSESGK
jgi:hypothetical protein